MRTSLFGISLIWVIAAAVLLGPLAAFAEIMVIETAPGGRDEPENPVTGWREYESYSGWGTTAEAYAWDGATWSWTYPEAATPYCHVQKYAVGEDCSTTLQWAYHGTVGANIEGHALQEPDNPDTNAHCGADVTARITGSSSTGSHKPQTAHLFKQAQEVSDPPAPWYFHLNVGYNPTWEIQDSGTAPADEAWVDVNHSCDASAWIIYDASDASGQAFASVSTCSLGGQ